MIQKLFPFIFVIITISACSDDVKEISIPVPVTHSAIKSSHNFIVSGTTLENSNSSFKTSFSINIISTAVNPGYWLGLPLVYSDSSAHGDFFATLDIARLEINKTYYIRSCFETDGERIYGNEVSFTTSNDGLRTIDEIVPNNGVAHDIIEIHGQNFAPGFTHVSLGYPLTSLNSYPVEIISISRTKIVFKVPETSPDYGSLPVNIFTFLYDYNEDWMQVESIFTVNPEE